jgi:nucleotide-binding universal stress UspA family protein
VVGYPAEEILKYADENNIDLIMLTTHGRSGVRVWDLGAVANKVIHAAKVPIWLVPTELREEVIYDRVPKRIMVIPLNGSKLAEGVIPHAVNIAKQRSAETEMVLCMLTLCPVPPATLRISNASKKNRQSMKKYLDEMVTKVGESGISARGETLIGDPATALIDYVKNHPTQLIAMATHGQSGLSRMIFGSVTEKYYPSGQEDSHLPGETCGLRLLLTKQ